MTESIEDLKEKAVLSHRILVMNRSMGDTTGHVFVRVPGADEFLARCRNPNDQAPAYVRTTAMHRIDFDGKPAEPTGDYLIAPERWIGAAIFRRRPEVSCVIHAHPPAQVLCANAGIRLRPIVGAQNNGGAALARSSIGVYPRALLIHNREIAGAMLAVMGDQNVVVLKGHGNVICGRSIEEATVRAIQVENLAKMMWQVALSGLKAPNVPWEDVEEAIARPETDGGGGNTFWEYYKRMYLEGRRIDAHLAAPA
ncbi:MAG: class II aldolase/adducin family protein [Chloroflexota bacterium]